jgi:hypothetical protein
VDQPVNTSHAAAWGATPAEMSAAAAAKPASRTRPRKPAAAPAPAAGKTTRITLDLDPAAYKQLNQWLGTTAAELGQPVSKARALRAMLTAVTLDKSIGLVVLDLLRQDHR